MKNKTNGNKNTAKRRYVGPNVTVLNPRGDQAAKLVDAIASGPPAKVEEIISNMHSEPKSKKKRA